MKHYTNRDSSNWNITWSYVSVSDDFGITILKPSHRSVWSQWLLEKQKPDITPPNLRNRSWHDFPRTEVHVTFMALLASSLRAKHWNVLFFLSFSIPDKDPGPSIRCRHGTRFDSEREVCWFCSTASACQELPKSPGDEGTVPAPTVYYTAQK